MELSNKKSLIYMPNENNDLKNTTYLCVSAHQDDIEIMAYSQIYECYSDKNKFFTAVNTTNGAGSPRTGKFKDFTDEDMVKIRIEEQKKASNIGKYNALIMMMYSSSEIKDYKNKAPVEDLKKIIIETQPEIVLTHNLLDKHPTHVATAIKVIEALKELKDVYRPKKVIGLEVWRDLDWLSENDKIYFDTSKKKRLEKDLLTVFESQVVGGKRYDLAAIGRRCANATFFESHSTDKVKGLNYGLDLTSFIYSNKTYNDFVKEKISNFEKEVISQMEILTK